MLACAGVDIKGGRIRHIASGIVRHNSHVIADLILLRPPLERVKGIAYGYVRRPRSPAIGAIGVEQLRINVVRSIPAVHPYGINTAVRRHSDCAKPVPLIRVDRIVVDAMGRAECCPAIRAP